MDHSPAAAALKKATGAKILGRPAPAGQDASFAPDEVLSHGQRVSLAGETLRVLHTPGDASNHLCYLLEGTRMLFTGDHVMQGSTVVINPPDGDMRAYLDSLELLLGEDLAMPEEDGYQLVEQLRRRGIGVPAAALTSFAGDDSRLRARALGFGAYLTKPIEPAKLVEALA